MPTSRQFMTLASGLRIIRDDDANATLEANITAGAAASLYGLSIDNRNNSSQKVYLKIYNAVAATVGTTAPNIVIPVAGGEIVTIMAIGLGIALPTGLSFACVTTGGTGGTTSPSEPVTVALVASW